MAGFLPGEPSHHGSREGNYRGRHDKEGGGRWYFSRKEIEENSPSRQDGIDLKKETYLRKSYCTFLQDLGMRVKVPQVTIATAIIFCHRFFLHQSHVKNDRKTIATVCMFLASKVEETPRPLKDVILVSYEIIHKKDAISLQRIKQKEVYEQQKELILLGERVVLATLGFDLNLSHPYKPLVEAIKKFEAAQNALAQVAWNFVNDGLRISLCLQFKPHHVAAGAIFLAAKFLKVKLPSDGEKVWWQEFDVTPRQLEEVSNQMLELYEQTRVPASQASEAEGRAGGWQQPPSKGPANTEHVTGYSSSHGGATPKAAASPPKLELPRPVPVQSHADNHSGPARVTQALSNDHGRSETNGITHCKGGYEINDVHHNEQEALPPPSNSEEIRNMPRFGMVKCSNEGNSGRMETRDAVDMKDKHHGRNVSQKGGIVHQSPRDATKKLDTEKIKAAFERRKARVDITCKMDPVDELERELEDVEVPDESEKIKHERKQSWSKPLNKPELENSYLLKGENEAGDGGYHQAMKGSSFHADNFDTVEEVERFFDSSRGYCKRKTADSSLDKPVKVKKRNDYGLGCQKQNHHDYLKDRNGLGRLDYSEKDLTRQVQNHV